MSKKLLLTVLCLYAVSNLVQAQALFQGLNQPLDARGWGMGAAISSLIGTPTGLVGNPALLTHIEPQWQCSFSKFVLDINAASATLVLPTDWLRGKLGLAFNYLDYGNFTRRDVEGNFLGEYIVSDQYFRLGYGRALTSRLNLGALLGYAHSNLDNYQAQVLFGSLGWHYYDPRSTISLGVAWNNLALWRRSYLDRHEKLPGTFTAGISKQLEHLPMILSVEGMAYRQYYLLKVGGEFDFGHRFFLRWGTSTRRFQIGSQATLLNFTSGSSIGLGLVFKTWRFDGSWLSLGHTGQVVSFSVGQNIQ